MSWKKYFTPVTKNRVANEDFGPISGREFSNKPGQQDQIIILFYQTSILEHLIVLKDMDNTILWTWIQR